LRIRSFFSEADLAAIRSATEEAEQLTGGELVCVIVGRCDDYQEASWRGAALGALTAVSIAAVSMVTTASWSPWGPAWMIGLVLAGLVLGWATVTLVPSLARYLADPVSLDLRVSRRAAAAFVDEEVFSTVDRTGVLLFIALFEHRVQILADEGVRQRVDESAWDQVIADLTGGLRSGQRGDAVRQAVVEIGRILATNKVPRRSEDVDELDNEPRIYDR